MSRTIQLFAFAAAWTPGLFASSPARADDETPKIISVIAIEEAQSLYGRYRIVFSISSPLPAARNAVGTPTFYLGSQRVTLPRGPHDSTTLFGYVNELPDANVMFKVISATPAAGMAGREPASELPVEPASLLSASRVSRGGFEAAHIRRSIGQLDVWNAWTNAGSALTGELLRRDVDPVAKDVYRFTFKITDQLRGAPPQRIDSMIVFRSSSPHYELELGGRYLLFCRTDAQRKALDTEMPPMVRVWWPQNDFVLTYLSGRASIAAADAPALRDFLVQELTSSPAVEVRFSASAELLALASRKVLPTSEQIQTIRSRAALEPSASVKSAMDRLIAASPNH